MLQFNKDEHVYGPSIEITSPEQFVPIFVAYMSPKIYEGYDHIFKIHVPIGTKYPTKEQLKDILLEQLNHPYPKRYAIPFTKLQIVKGLGEADSPSSTTADNFYGSTIQPRANYLFVGLPGVLAYIQDRHWYSLATNTYRSTLLSNTPNLFNIGITPLIVTVVKAKYIPYLRARLMLKLPIELPLESIRVLKNHSNIGNYVNFDNFPLDTFLRTYEIQAEVARDSVMRDYLLGLSEVKTHAQYLADALTAITNPEQMEPINV